VFCAFSFGFFVCPTCLVLSRRHTTRHDDTMFSSNADVVRKQLSALLVLFFQARAVHAKPQVWHPASVRAPTPLLTKWW
jgi:hypothetical protein